MIDALRTWLTSVIMVAMLLSLVQVLIPKGSVQQIASFTGGLILMLALLCPLLGVEFSEVLPDLQRYQAEIYQRWEELEAVEVGYWEESIAEKTQAYISDKGAQMGWEGTVRVTVENSPEGVPVPTRAELTGPHCEALEQMLVRELGIPVERQVWHGCEN